jgi:hypothetical protein
MSDAWTWACDPDAEHVVSGLPSHIVAEVECWPATPSCSVMTRRTWGTGGSCGIWS